MKGTAIKKDLTYFIFYVKILDYLARIKILKNGSENTNNKYYKQYINLGLEILAAVLIGTGLGYWLDGLFGISPWLMIGGFFLGAAAGFINIFRLIASEEGKDK